MQLWSLLQRNLPDEVARVAHQCEPVAGSARDLLELLDDRYSNAEIANGRCGYIGNPYEQLGLDYFRLVKHAREISGQQGRPRWERCVPANATRDSGLQKDFRVELNRA